MANTIIHIENIQGKWNAEVEMGSFVARRKTIRADSFEACIAEVTAAYTDYNATFADRAIFSGPSPDFVLPSVADVPLDPATNSPKLPRGRHKAACTCPRCETKRKADAHVEAVTDEVAAL